MIHIQPENRGEQSNLTAEMQLQREYQPGNGLMGFVSAPYSVPCGTLGFVGIVYIIQYIMNLYN